MQPITVGPLLSKPDGYIARYDRVKLPGTFTDASDIASKNEVVFDLEIIKLPHEFTAHISDLSYQVPTKCTLCLADYTEEMWIESASRQYIYDLPKEDVQTDEEVEYIDKKVMTIDILPFVREELLLHFPSFPVCSDGCKGLCATCGVNKNTTTCDCKQGDTENPFKQLLSEDGAK